jgi:hypothetical protein
MAASSVFFLSALFIRVSVGLHTCADFSRRRLIQIIQIEITLSLVILGKFAAYGLQSEHGRPRICPVRR